MSALIATAARFSGRAIDYAKYRPSYPREAIDAITAGFEDPAVLRIVDIGAGTGISSRLFAERGARVIAIEPNPEMREAARAVGIDARDATAERTGLPNAGVDIVAAFQAFHWFANAAAVAEFVRILRPGGRVALVWNVRDDHDPFTRDYGRIADVDSVAAERAGQSAQDPDLESLLRAGGLANFRSAVFHYAQQLSLDALLGRARSASYVPREGPEYEAIARDLAAVHRRFADRRGVVRLVYRTHVHVADKP